MKVKIVKDARVILHNRGSHHGYFAWPTAVRLKNGRIAVACSGYRLGHICPFGKSVISYSEDEGETWTRPAPVIDTVLDDRDAGLCTFGESGLIFTSFNNRVEFQRRLGTGGAYRDAYLDTITPEEEEEAIGSSYRISTDNGVTFGPRYKSPVTSPHGPTVLPDGTVVWVGMVTEAFDKKMNQDRVVRAYTINGDHMEFLSELPRCRQDAYVSEPYAIALPDGKIICMIRGEKKEHGKPYEILTLFQTVSGDGGKTWSAPRQINGEISGAPAFILRLRDGTLIATYSHRNGPNGIRAMISRDEGETWETDLILWTGNHNWDVGYPCSVELADGNILTVFYAHETPEQPAEIFRIVWKLEE